MSANQSLRQKTNPNHPPQQQMDKPQRKRNKPGRPDPKAVVVSLSPERLLAKGIYVCEVCNMGFQREQNLQLHRRTHNLEAKLKKTGHRNVKQVYTCPEPTCVHHDPSRALSDLSGIKKHYMRKHCEKKWKCGQCGRMYACESDLKSHSNNCHSTVCTCECGDEFRSNDDYLAHRKCCHVALRENPWPFFPTGGSSSDGGTRGEDQNGQPGNIMPDDPDFLRAVPEGLQKVVMNSPSSLGMLCKVVDHGRGASLQSPRLGVGPSMSTSSPGLLQGSGAYGSSSTNRREQVPATAVLHQVMEAGAVSTNQSVWSLGGGLTSPTNFPMVNRFEGPEQQMVFTGKSSSFSLFHRPSELQLPDQERALHGPPPSSTSCFSGLPQNVNEDAGMGQSQIFGQVELPGAFHDPMVLGEGANGASSNVSLELPALNAQLPSMAPSFADFSEVMGWNNLGGASGTQSWQPDGRAGSCTDDRDGVEFVGRGGWSWAAEGLPAARGEWRAEKLGGGSAATTAVAGWLGKRIGKWATDGLPDAGWK